MGACGAWPIEPERPRLFPTTADNRQTVRFGRPRGTPRRVVFHISAARGHFRAGLRKRWSCESGAGGVTESRQVQELWAGLLIDQSGNHHHTRPAGPRRIFELLFVFLP